MKRAINLLKAGSVLLILLLTSAASSETGQGAVDYLNMLAEPSRKISGEMWEYVRSSAHSKNAAQVEARRRALVATVAGAHRQTIARPAYEGDAALRNSVVTFLSTLHSMLNQDYAKIINMEEVSEQSYDAMEAYLLAKKKAGEKLDQAAQDLTAAEQAFANRYHITLIHTEDAISRNLKISARVMDYYNEIYLLFFKSYKQEKYLLDALNAGDINRLEQSRLALARFSKEGLKKLKDLDSYEGDKSLLRACDDYLSFVRAEAEESGPILSDFLMRKEAFDRLKQAFDLKKPAERTREDVDLYNAKVRDYNEGREKFNHAINEDNRRRSTNIDAWNRAAEAFIDQHVPK